MLSATIFICMTSPLSCGWCSCHLKVTKGILKGTELSMYFACFVYGLIDENQEIVAQF